MRQCDHLTARGLHELFVDLRAVDVDRLASAYAGNSLRMIATTADPNGRTLWRRAVGDLSLVELLCDTVR